ncbi:MAG: sensor domain-containing diguanylate cyclase [Thiotrichales bacterium]|nr:sensor domain-containing diguanylate cyclase [Thiotrichales bacterium]
MINIATMHEMLGLSFRECIEIQDHVDYLGEQKADFLADLSAWLEKFDFPENDLNALLVDDFYDVLVSGEFSELFYVTNYHQAIIWHKLGLSQSQVMLLLSQCRQLFINISEKRNNTSLARALCHAIDLGQSIVSSVYFMHEAMQHMKRKSSDEVGRMRRSFQVISAAAPEDLIQAYIDHQDWKVRAYSLALGEVEEGHFPYSTSDCLLGQWLNSGGLESIPESDRESFNQAHEKVHRLGHLALTEALAHHPERIIEFLVEMELASDEVGRVLLDLIEAEFIRLATLDTLTDLPTRRAFDAKLQKNIAFSQRHDFWVGMLLVDIDYFKAVNDEHGHASGDKVLKEIATLLNDTVRQEDLVYRWGGEEFAILSLDKEPEGGQLAERIRQRVEKHVFECNPNLKLTVSCGAISVPSASKATEDQLFAAVDDQLYRSKNNGRNQVSYCTLEAE